MKLNFDKNTRIKLLSAIAQKYENNFKLINIPLTYQGTVLARTNPIINDNYINILIQIRGIDASMTNQLTNTNLNSVIIAVDAGGMASAENTQKFGSIDFVNKTVDEVLAYFSKLYKKDIKLNKLGIASFSGGFGAVGKILEQRNKCKYTISAVYNFDGMHYSKKSKDETGRTVLQADPVQMKPWLDFAAEAANDPNKQMIVVYTAIEPGSYVGNTETAKYLNSKLNANNYSSQSQWNSTQPLSVATKGGYAAYQLYDKNSKLQGGAQHVKANEAKFDVFKLIAPNWNDISSKQKPIVELDNTMKENKNPQPIQQTQQVQVEDKINYNTEELTNIIADIAKSII